MELNRSTEEKRKASEVRDKVINFKYPPKFPKIGEVIKIFKDNKTSTYKAYAIEVTVMNRWVEVQKDAKGEFKFRMGIEVSSVNRKTHGYNFFTYDQVKKTWSEGAEIIRPTISKEEAF